MISFSYYSGSGNTFLITDNREGLFPLEMIPKICNKENVDGILLLEESRIADFRMRIFNRDGSEAEMCGNGLRCFIDFLWKKGSCLPVYQIETLAGLQIGWFEKTNITVRMPSPSNEKWHISLPLQEKHYIVHHVNTGVPHTILFIESNEVIDVAALGSQMRNHLYFQPRGTNVNFVHLTPQGISVRTYERGVEAETLACGTGAVASAYAAAKLFGLPYPLFIKVHSGEQLEVNRQDEFMHLCGPVKLLNNSRKFHIT